MHGIIITLNLKRMVLLFTYMVEDLSHNRQNPMKLVYLASMLYLVDFSKHVHK